MSEHPSDPQRPEGHRSQSAGGPAEGPGQGYGQQPQYGQIPPQGYGYPYPPVDPRAQSQATTALVLGIVGLVSMLGVILGPIALVQAKKAREGGADATAGRVLGWIATIIGALSVLLIIGWVIFVFSILGTALHNSPTGTPSAAGLTAPLRVLFA